jgi:microcystin-dependent protein
MIHKRVLVLAAAVIVLPCPIASAKQPPAISVDSAAMVGEIRAFAISDGNGQALTRLYNAGWVPADGRSLPKARYPELFGALGTTWGTAQDQASFLVPDLRGVFLRGFSGQSGRDPDAADRLAGSAGGAAGNHVGSYQADAMQTHKHLDAGHTHPLNQREYDNGRGRGPYDQSSSAPLDSGLGYANIGEPVESSGSGGPVRVSSENRPKNVDVYYFVFVGRRIIP